MTESSLYQEKPDIISDTDHNTPDCSRPLVSVIVPVYNGEKHLLRCLRSILRQTYDNLEILCMDDGSSDRSPEILDACQERYPDKIRVVHQENMGTGRTRNRAMAMAKGTYLMFSDNDDVYDRDYVETMVSFIEREQLDMVIAGYRMVSDQGKILARCPIRDQVPWDKFRLLTSWIKILRRQYVMDHHITFGEIPLGEDCVFSISAYNYTDRIRCVDYIGYSWVQYPDSVFHSVQKKKMLDGLETISQMEKANPVLIHVSRDEYDYSTYKFLMWHLLYTRRDVKTEDWKKQEKRYHHWLLENNAMYREKRIPFFGPRGEKASYRILLWLLSGKIPGAYRMTMGLLKRI